MGENNSRKKRIVAVNDTSFQLTLLRSILEKAGYDVVCHESAEEALRSMTPENIPDLIITDLHMPGIDGWRFCRLLRSPEYSHLNQVPILANSATFGGEDTLSISSAAGADAFLESPYKADDLLRFVHDLISGEEPEKKPSLLIVEDAKALANNLGRVLKQVGFDVAIAYDGENARKLFDLHKPETVILDQHLPDSTGMELLEAFEAESSKTVFILVTGDEDPELAVKAMKNGASAFVRKPCSNDYLVELIRKAHREKSLMAVENLLEHRTQKLLEEERRHKTVMDAAHEGFCISIDGVLHYGNPALAKMLGETVESIIHTNLSRYIDEVDRERITSIYQRYENGEHDLGLQVFSLSGEDGKKRIVEVSGSRIEYEGKEAVLCVLRDVTETRQLERELDQQRQRYADMLSNMQIAVMLLDKDMRVLWANEFTKSEFPDRDPVGCFCYEHFENREFPVEDCPVVKCFETGKTQKRESFNPRSGKWYFSTAYPIKDEHGDVVRVMETAIDITERRRQEETLRLQRDLSVMLASAMDLNETLRASLTTSIRISGLDCGGIYLVDERDGALTLSHHEGIPSALLEKMIRYDADSPQANLVRRLKTRYASHRDILSEIGLNQSESRIKALAIVPVVHKGKAVGCLNLGSFTDEDIPQRSRLILETIAGQIGAVIVRDRIFSELQVQRENLATFFNTIHDFLFVMDENGTVIQTNNTVSDRLGYSPEENVNKSVLEFHPADLREEAGRIVEEMLAGRREICDIPLLAKDGRLIPVETKVSKGRWNGQPAIFGISRDITERKIAEEALRRSEEKYSTIVNMAPEAIFTCDSQGLITFANDQASSLLNIRQENLLAGKSIFDFLPGEEAEKVIANQCLTLEGEDPGPGEYKAVRGDGELIDIEVHGEVLRDASGQFSGWLLMARDITEQKRLNEALEASEQRLNLALQVAHMGYWDWEVETNQVRWFGESAALFGTTPESFDETLNGVQAHVHPADQDQGIEACRRCVEDDLPFDNTYRVVWPSGEVRWLHSLGKLFRDEQGKPVHVFGVTTDVTDRKMAENILIEREERFRKLIQNSNDILVILDEAGQVLYISESVERITGFIPEECIGKTSFEFLHPDDVEEMRAAFFRLLQSPVQTIQVEYRHRTMDGGWVYLEAIGTNWLHEPTIRGIVLNVRDVTERKQSEDEKDKLEQQLTQAMKMEAIGRLAGGVAHDFNNILTGISGNASMAMMDYASDPLLMETFEEINNASDRAAGLTRQLLAFSRKQILEPKVISLNRLIEDLMKMLVRLIGEDVSFTFSPKRRLGRVHADPGQIEQVVINLCVNARDAMPNGGKLLIETSDAEFDEAYCENHQYVTPGRYVLMAVSDTGTGMDEETLRHIFEPFFTTKPKGQGTGLGLATIYGIIKQHEGHIEVYSEPGQGTTFKVYLPSTRDAAENPSTRDNLSSLKSGTETVLLVEDEDLVRSVGVKILKRLGYTVLEATSAQEARKISDDYESDIDLLLTDVVMPGENGRELARYIEKKRAGIKVLYTSGYTENAIAHHGVLDEGLNFIGKPFTPSELARKIRELLDEE